MALIKITNVGAGVDFRNASANFAQRGVLRPIVAPKAYASHIGAPLERSAARGLVCKELGRTMCYSLEASVVAGAGLAVAGAGMVAKAARNDRRMLGFAAFPLVFSLHQFTEGAVWSSIAHPVAGDEFFRYLYTIIAFLVWPVLTPHAAAVAETDPARRRIWNGMVHCGMLLAFYLAFKLAGAQGIDVSVVRHSLAYDPLFERPPLIVDLVYVLLTVVPLVCFANRAINLFGVAVFATFIYSLIENRAAWYSVWCLAAALFSFILAFAIQRETRETMDEAPA
jgi:hypothetical protein